MHHSAGLVAHLEQPNYTPRTLISAFSDSTVTKMKDKQTLLADIPE